MFVGGVFIDCEFIVRVCFVCVSGSSALGSKYLICILSTFDQANKSCLFEITQHSV